MMIATSHSQAEERKIKSQFPCERLLERGHLFDALFSIHV